MTLLLSALWRPLAWLLGLLGLGHRGPRRPRPSPDRRDHVWNELEARRSPRGVPAFRHTGVRPDVQPNRRSSSRRRVRRGLLLPLVVVLALATAGAAVAFWTAAGSGSGAAQAGSLKPPTGVTAGPASGSTVPVDWTQSLSGSGAVAPKGYYVESSSNGGTAWSPACASGPGTLLPGTATSCSDLGLANGSYIYRVTAVYDLWAAASGPSTPAVTVSAGAAKLVITTGPQTLTAGVTSATVTMQRQNASNTPVTSGATTVDLSTDSAGGVFRNAADTATITQVTIANGVSSVDFEYNDTLAGQPTISAGDHAAVLAWGMQTESVNPSSPQQLAFTQAPGTTSADNTLAPQPKVTILDQYGNTVTGDGSTVALSITAGTPTGGGGPGALTGCSQTETNGVVSFTGCAITTAGAGYELHATDGAISAADSSAFGVTPGSATSVSIKPTPSAATTSSTTNIALALQLEDQFGNNTTSSGATMLTLSTASSAGFFSATSGDVGTATATVSFGNGVGIVTEYYGDEDASASTSITAKSDTSPWGTASVRINPGAADHFSVSGPSAATAGSPVSVSVTAEDQFGNTASGYVGTVQFTASDGGVGLVLPVNYTFVAGDEGARTFANGVTFVGAGSQSVTVTDTVTASITGSVGGIAVTAGSAAKLVLSAGDNQSAVVNTGFGSPLVALVTDAFGNPVSGATVTFTASGSTATGTFLAASNGGACLSSGGSAAASCTATTDANGRASSLTLTAGTVVGSYSLTAAASGTTPSSISFNATNLPGAADHFSVSGPSAATAGSPVSVSVTAEDQFGNTASGYVGTVQFTASDGGVGLVLPVNYTFVAGDEGARTFANGVTFVGAGSQSVTVTDTVTASITGSVGGIAVTAGSAAKLVLSAGDNQSAVVNTGFGSPLVALVTDAFGNPVSGATVTFTASGSTATGTFLAASNGGACLSSGGSAAASCTATTDANGRASSLTLTAGTVVGSYSLTAAASGTTPSSISFKASNLPGPD